MIVAWLLLLSHPLSSCSVAASLLITLVVALILCQVCCDQFPYCFRVVAYRAGIHGGDVESMKLFECFQTVVCDFPQEKSDFGWI